MKATAVLYRFVIFMMVTLSVNVICAQSDSTLIKEKLKRIAHTAEIAKNELHLSTHKDFFNFVADGDSLYTFVYVSSKDSVKNVLPGRFLFLDNDPQRARLKADSLRKSGYDVMVYLTAGTSGSAIHRRMFQYDDLSISFIMLHEAMHLDLGPSGIRVTYDYEESIGDAVANTYLYSCFNKDKKHDVKRFVKCNEKVYRTINKCLKSKISKENAESKIFNITEKYGTGFQKERYRYTVNNAYLLRYRDYTLNYFELKKLFRKHPDINETLRKRFVKKKIAMVCIP